MKISEKIQLTKSIAREINSRYSFDEAFIFLRAFIGQPQGSWDDYRDVEDYAFWNLREAETSVLGEIVDDLGIESIGITSNQIQRPKVWQDTEEFRIFVSHISNDKDKAKRLRDALAEYGVSAFVAHEDIEPALDWEVQIQRALHAMEAFVSIHTLGFSGRDWCQQEVGFAVAKGVKVMALRMGEDPTGFISKHQAISRGQKTAEEIAIEIDKLLLADDRTKARYGVSKEAIAIDDDIPF